MTQMDCGIIDQERLINHLIAIHNSTKNDFRWRNLRKLIKDYLSNFEKLETEILDLGCGTGHLTLDLLKEGYKVSAVDISKELIDFTLKSINEEGYSIDARVMNIHNLDWFGAQRFDAVICLDVLEHVKDDNSALKNINYILKSNGLLICSVPALMFLYGKRDSEIGHFRRYDKIDLINKIETSGFHVDCIRYWNFAGILPVLIYEKLLHKRVYEKMRYSQGYRQEILNTILGSWFGKVENKIHWPIGLTLIAFAKKI